MPQIPKTLMQKALVWFKRKQFLLNQRKILIQNQLGFTNSENQNKIKSLHNIHQGKRAFLLGSGPSLNVHDLNLIKDEITFGCNKQYLIFDQTEWRPSYFCVIDALVAEQNYEMIEALDLPSKLLSDKVSGFFSDNEKIIFTTHRDHEYSKVPFSTDLLKNGFFHGGTVIYAMLQYAYYMGIREIYILGLDFKFDVEKKAKDDLIKLGDSQWIKGEGEVNHFHADYRKPGEWWALPRLDVQRIAFQKAKEAFESQGGKIYNVSRQTALDVFPLANLEEVLEEIV